MKKRASLLTLIGYRLRLEGAILWLHWKAANKEAMAGWYVALRWLREFFDR